MKLLFILIICFLFLNIVNSISLKYKYRVIKNKKFDVVLEFQTDNSRDCRVNNTRLYFACLPKNGKIICGCSKESPIEFEYRDYRDAPPDSDFEIETENPMNCDKRNLKYECRHINGRLMCGCLKDKNKRKPVCKEDEELAFYSHRDEYRCVKKRIIYN